MMVDAYERGMEFKNFPDLEQQITQYYDTIYETIEDLRVTPRYFLEMGLKVTERDMFYYINRLYDNNPSSVVDVGCAECIWKKWFPRMIGFDPIVSKFSKQQDFIDTFNKNFIQKHAGHYHSGMALNSLHFIDWKDISKVIDAAMSIVQDRFLFTFNFNIIANIPNHVYFNGRPPHADLISQVDKIIVDSGYKIILVDWPCLREGRAEENRDRIMIASEQLNGHVRFILAHNN